MSSSRIGEHIRQNLVGYLALFVALSATAWAAPKITSKQIAKNAIKAKHITDGQVGSAEITDNGLTGTDIDESTLKELPGGATYSAAGPLTLNGTTFGLQDCAANQVLKRTGGDTAWSCSTDVDTNSGGTVTSVSAGNGLAGGPITTTGSLALRSCLDEAILKVVGVTWQCSSDESQPTGAAGGDLQGSYPNPALAAGAVAGGPGGEIQDGSVDANDLAAAAVTPDEVGTFPAANAFNTTGEVVTAAQDYKPIPLPGESYDTTSTMHSQTTNSERIVAPRSGLYQVSTTVTFTPNNTDDGREARLRAIGPFIDQKFAWQAVHERDSDGVNEDTVINLAGAVALNAGDYVQVEVEHGLPGTPLVYVNPVTMYWVGPKP
jgi:hypothetical protein